MSPHQGTFIAYFRVSTDKQGKSGLGRCSPISTGAGGRWCKNLSKSRSGKRNDRPELMAALSRNLAFIATLMDSGVEFVAVDNPHANKLTVHILAAVAQHERELIAQRTRDALQAAKARGKKLGNPKLGTARKLAIEGNKAAAARYAANALPVIREIQASGVNLFAAWRGR